MILPTYEIIRSDYMKNQCYLIYGIEFTDKKVGESWDNLERLYCFASWGCFSAEDVENFWSSDIDLQLIAWAKGLLP